MHHCFLELEDIAAAAVLETIQFLTLLSLFFLLSTVVVMTYHE